ncbi:MAG: hypothetical protein KDB80_04365 [Planctomycetes bacterium]|nr:hypothetical protein [Planctomycetota bacterium]
MTDTHDGSHATPVRNIEDRSFFDVFADHIGEVFLIANPQSFEEGALGPKLQEDFYPAKLIGLGRDYLVFVIPFSHGGGKNAEKEAARQYVPLHSVKRVSFMKSQRVLHL